MACFYFTVSLGNLKGASNEMYYYDDIPTNMRAIMTKAGAGGQGSILSILSIQVKSIKGDKKVQKHASLYLWAVQLHSVQSIPRKT